jgi:hypothetical protein
MYSETSIKIYLGAYINNESFAFIRTMSFFYYLSANLQST